MCVCVCYCYHSYSAVVDEYDDDEDNNNDGDGDEREHYDDNDYDGNIDTLASNRVEGDIDEDEQGHAIVAAMTSLCLSVPVAMEIMWSLTCFALPCKYQEFVTLTCVCVHHLILKCLGSLIIMVCKLIGH